MHKIPSCVLLLKESKELVQQHTAAARAVDRLRSRAGVREREVEELARDVELAKIETEKLLAEQVAWDLEVRDRGEACLAGTWWDARRWSMR